MKWNRPISLAVVGATGSVGGAVLDVCRRFPEKFRVVGLAAGKNVASMASLVKEFNPQVVTMASPEARDLLRSALDLSEKHIFLEGQAGLEEMLQVSQLDQVVFAASGTETLPALMNALERGLDVSLANKESLVVGGPWVVPKVSRPDQLRPVDSEHSAVWECLRGEAQNEIVRLGLTASGGPFRDFCLQDLESVTPRMALKHPVWAMGGKITIDSATLMNKGLEILEAMYLFQIPLERIEAVVHPDSLVHGYVVFRDGTLKMALSRPDMRLPAALALAYPERLPLFSPEWPPAERQQWALQFARTDEKRFPCLALAREAGEKQGPYPALLVGSDEVAVQAFLEERIRFTDIPVIVEEVMSAYSDMSPRTLNEALGLIRQGRQKAWELVRTRG